MASKTINTILNLKDNFSKTLQKTTDKTKKFKYQLNQAQNAAKTMRQVVGKSFIALGAGAVAAGTGLWALSNKTAESLDAIDKMSERTGINRERLQELKYAAGQCGVEFETIENAVKMLTKSMGKSSDGNKKINTALQQMGVKINNVKGQLKPASDLFEEAALKLADMKDQTQRNILGQKVFGGAWQDLIPLINQGSNGIKELTDRSRKLGLIVSEDNVKAGVTFGDTLDDLKQSVQALGTKLITNLMPYLQKASDFLLEKIPKIEPAVRRTIDNIQSKVKTLKDNLNWLIPVTSGVISAFLAFQAITSIVGAFAAVKKATQGLTVAQAILNTTMLANPMMLVALSVGALVGLAVLLWRNWDKVTAKFREWGDWIKKNMPGLVTYLQTAWQGIKNGIRNTINFVTGAINVLLKVIFAPFNTITQLLNKIPGVKAPVLKLEIPKLPKFATGTEYFKGGFAQTDEHGGEIKAYPNGTKIIPADKSKKILGGVNIAKLADTIIVREDADIDKIATAIARKITATAVNMA
mgnify:CR=1 FL=1